VPLDASAGGPLPTRRDRRVERSAALTLAAPSDDVADVADGVVRVTDRFRGVVASSSVSDDDSGQATATFDLRIPTARLDAALAELSRLAHVRSRSESSFDVTRPYVSARERVQRLTALRDAALRRVALARDDREEVAARGRLSRVTRRLARSRARLGALRARTSYSAIAVSVAGDRSARPDGGAWTPGDALHDAGRILAVAAGVALVALALALPLAFVALAALAAARIARRRRRERALDAV
jgi:hypothetical protein